MSTDQSKVTIPTLIECFSPFSDARISRYQTHKPIATIIIALCSVIASGQGPMKMEALGQAKIKQLRQFLELPHGIASHDTFGCVLSLIDPREFQQCLLKWAISKFELGVGDVVPIDGKALRRSHYNANWQEAFEIVNARTLPKRLTLGPVKVADTFNEIPAVA